MTQPFEGALVVGVDDGCGVVGAGVGVTEGAGVGLTEGAGVGRKLGLTDGCDEGRGEGAVGVFVGIEDGTEVGRAVGAGQVPFASSCATPHDVAAHLVR